MMKKKILIVNPISLFPTYAMNQVRTLHMTKSLLRHFDVDVITPYNSQAEYEKSVAGFIDLGVRFFPLRSKKHRSNLLKKRQYQIWERLNFYLLGIDTAFIAGRRYQKEILSIVKKNKYDFIISNYWEISDFFRFIKVPVVKILDTHYAVKENLEVFEKNKYHSGIPFFKKRELKKSLFFEKRISEASDIILSLSTKCLKIFSHDHPAKTNLMIADGNDLRYYSEMDNLPEGNTIIFYGSMSSSQNIGAFFRTFKEILPLIKQQVSDVKLVVVGNKPPVEIQNLHNGRDIIVTGYVEDVRPWLSKGKLLVLPLELGSGFRGRIVEVMAMGLPVVGTHNALDSLEMESGVQGLISDDNKEMADYCIRLLIDGAFRIKHSNACKQFVKEKYSLEATFDKLTNYLVKYNNLKNLG